MKKNIVVAILVSTLSLSSFGIIANAASDSKYSSNNIISKSVQLRGYDEGRILYSESKNGGTYNYYVEKMQKRLNAYFRNSGHSGDVIEADGDYGPITTRAVKKFQIYNGLDYQDGKFRQETADCLSNWLD